VTPERLALGFDFGRRRIGVAVGGSATGRATPLTVVRCRDDGPDWQAIAELVETWQPNRLVVGLPYNDDGSESEMTRLARRFAGRLQARFRIPAELKDERLSSREAEDQLRRERASGARRRRVRKEDVDMGAAAVILQGWLDDNC
jgi:putative Holliday junction resolvase